MNSDNRYDITNVINVIIIVVAVLEVIGQRVLITTKQPTLRMTNSCCKSYFLLSLFRKNRLMECKSRTKWTHLNASVVALWRRSCCKKNGRLKIARHVIFHRYNNYILVNIIWRWLTSYLKYIALMIDCLQPVHEVHWSDIGSSLLWIAWRTNFN